MPALTNYSEQKPIKMLLVGDSGKGKTGALASLAQLGFKLRILDYDNGVGILASVLKDSPQALANIVYESCLDEFTLVGNNIVPKSIPQAFVKGMGLLTKWKTKDLDLGNISSWDRNSILVIDSLSHLSNAALIHVLAMNKRSGQHPWQSDWGQAMDMVEGVLKILYSDSIRCHVIVNAHITYVGGTENDKGQIVGAKPYPNSLGQKLPPKISQYFNTMLQADSIQLGERTKRIIRTTPNSELGVKCEILGIPKELPLESGLADFFKLANQLPSKE